MNAEEIPDISEILARGKSKREANWLKPPPAPSLQHLIEYHGGYDHITPEAWAEHDAAIAKWRLDRADYYMQLRNSRKNKAA